MARRQDFGGHPQDSKTIFRILRSSSKRQDDRIHDHPGDRSSISCHSVKLITRFQELVISAEMPILKRNFWAIWAILGDLWEIVGRLLGDCWAILGKS